MNLLELTNEVLSKEIIIESLSPTVYHATKFNVVRAILSNDVAKLSHIKKSGLVYTVVDTKKYPYYLSCARTMNSGYFRKFLLSENLLVLELDGGKLSQNYKGKAVNWFGAMNINPRNKVFFYTDEAEDRLYSKNKEIPNFKKYIKAIHSMNIETTKEPESGRIHRVGMEEPLRRLKEVAGNIPIYMYNNKKDYLVLRKDKAIKI